MVNFACFQARGFICYGS